MQYNAPPRHSFRGGNALGLPTLSGRIFGARFAKNSAKRHRLAVPGDQKCAKKNFAHAARALRARLTIAEQDV
jgi:hypothetical protein